MSERAVEYQLGFSDMHSAEMYDAEKRTIKARKTMSVICDYLDGVGKNSLDLTLLDIGSSTGLMTQIYGQHFKKVVGIDIDAPAVEFARNAVQEDHIEFCVRDSMDTQFPDNSFDVATCTQVYEHVPDSGKLVNEIYRVLKPGGVCYFAAGNRVKLMEAHYRLPLLSVVPKALGHLYVRAFGKADKYYETHLSYWGLRKLVSKFEITDYTRSVIEFPEKYSATDLIEPGSLKQRLSLMALDCAYWTCPTYIWILRKPV